VKLPYLEKFLIVSETFLIKQSLTFASFSAEIGATTSLFPFNDRMYEYLAATKRSEIGDFARVYAKELREDENAEVL
jgi:aconitase A